MFVVCISCCTKQPWNPRLYTFLRWSSGKSNNKLATTTCFFPYCCSCCCFRQVIQWFTRNGVKFYPPKQPWKPTCLLNLDHFNQRPRQLLSAVAESLKCWCESKPPSAPLMSCAVESVCFSGSAITALLLARSPQRTLMSELSPLHRGDKRWP